MISYNIYQASFRTGEIFLKLNISDFMLGTLLMVLASTFFFFRKKESNFKNSGIGHLKLYMPEAQVWNQCNPCEICGRQRGSGTGSFQISLFTSVNYHYANFLNSPTYKPFHSHSTKHLSHMVPQQ